MRHVGKEELEQAITTGIVFKGTKLKKNANTNNKKVKTKAKKKKYITGQHGSASALKKKEIRTKRANRPSQSK